jgi:putative oxidoreductase
MKIINLAVVYLTALMFVVFGLNKFLGFANPPMPTDPTALSFLGAMFGSYLGKFVGIFEIIGGLLLLLNRTRFVGVLILLPIVVNIIVFHIAHDMPGNGIWIFISILFALACYFQASNFQSLLKLQTNE